MQQRRLRLGDILDDYCPRERRITNHAVVAMIEDEVKQTRCTTCDADHEYKAARVPPPRRKTVRRRRRRACRRHPAPASPRRKTPSRWKTDAEAEILNDDARDVDDARRRLRRRRRRLTIADADAVPLAAGSRDEDDGPVHRR